MPNWVKNRIEFDCPKELYWKVCDKILKPWEPGMEPGDRIDFNRIIPEPGAWTGDEWYHWRTEHWGCKWNACESEILDDEQTFYFMTPWSHPEPVIRALAKMFPAVGIKHLYADEFPNYTGITEYRGGKKVSEEWYDEDGAGIFELCWGCQPLSDDEDADTTLIV